MNERETKLTAAVASLAEQQVRWTRDLIAIPTVNPYSGDASAGNEAAGQAWVEDFLRGIGAQTQRIPVPADVYARAGFIGPAGRKWDGRDNVVGRWVLGSGDGPEILLNDHIDTVGTDGMEFAPFDPRVHDGKIFGRGSSDTKGNMVMGLVALKALLGSASGLNGRIVFESVVDEECDGAAAGTIACCLAGVRGDIAIGLDGSAGQVTNGCNGIATARLFVRGKSGHNAAGASINAIDKAILVKHAIDRFAAERLVRYPACRTNIGVFRAGTLPAIVPGLAELQVNMSYSPAEALECEQATGTWGGEKFRAEFERAIAHATSADAWLADHPVEVGWIKDPYPFLCDANDDAIQLAARTASEVHGRPIPVAPMPAWFDGAHLSRRLRVPTFGLGHGTPGAPHSADESVVINDLLRGAQTVALTVMRLLSRPLNA